jgi:hypothetical protein
MPSHSEPFPEAEVRRWGRYRGAPSDEQLSRFFVLGPADLERADRARSEVTRLGYALQLGTGWFLGAFPADSTQTPQAVVRHVAAQVGADPAAWEHYVGAHVDSRRGQPPWTAAGLARRTPPMAHPWHIHCSTERFVEGRRSAVTSSFGSSAFGQVRLYSVRDAEVAGSNPAFPTSS